MSRPSTLSRLVIAVAVASVATEARGQSSGVADQIAAGEPLDLSTAIERALQSAPRLREAEAGVAVREAEADAARVGYWPTLSVEAGYARVDGFDDGTIETPMGQIVIEVPRDRTRFRGRLDFPLTDSLVRVRPTVRAAEARVEAERVEVGADRAEVVLATTLAYLDYAKARADSAVTEARIRRARSHAERLAAMAEAGLATTADRLDAEARVAEAESRQAAAESAVAVAGEALAQWMDVPARRWAVRLPMVAETSAVGALTAEALDRRAELAAIRARIEAAEAQGTAARAGRWPMLGAYGAYEVSNPNPNVVPPEDDFRQSWELGVYARWSPNAYATASRQGRRADAQVEVLRAREAAIVRATELSVRQSHAQLEASHARVRAAEARLEAARRAHAAREAELEAGTAAVADLLRSEEALALAQHAVWAARVHALRAEARLRRAVGAPRE